MNKNMFTLVRMYILDGGITFEKEAFKAKRTNRLPTASYLSMKEKKERAVKYSHSYFRTAFYPNGATYRWDEAQVLYECEFDKFLGEIRVNDQQGCNSAYVVYAGEDPEIDETNLYWLMLSKLQNAAEASMKQSEEALRRAQEIYDADRDQFDSIQTYKEGTLRPLTTYTGDETE